MYKGQAGGAEEERIDWHFTGFGRLPCRVGNGFGPGEYGITIEYTTSEGEKVKVNTISSGSDVALQEEPTPGNYVDGELRVKVLQELPDSVVVLLPFDSINLGYTLKLPKELLLGEPKVH